MRVTKHSYTKDQLYPKVLRAVKDTLQTQATVTSIDVLLRLQRLSQDKYEDWRFGRIPYLEKVLIGNLSKLNRILRILDLCAQDLKLLPSETVYRKWGKGRKRIILRFSKSGDPNIETAYSRCYSVHRQNTQNHGAGNTRLKA
jgi:hypothetical protein